MDDENGPKCRRQNQLTNESQADAMRKRKNDDTALKRTTFLILNSIFFRIEAVRLRQSFTVSKVVAVATATVAVTF